MYRIFECGVLLRVYTMCISALYTYTALSQEDTLTYQVAHADQFATLCMSGLGIFALLGFIDVIINDILPERFVFHKALRDRHLISMAISMCFAVQMWTCVKYELSYAVLPFYTIYALMVPVSAFADVQKRYKRKV